FHAYLQLSEPGPGESRDALMAALAYRRVKTVIAVDTDINIFDNDTMLWALATRVRWDRDTISVAGLSGSSLDPSLPEGVSTVTKMGVDATIPTAARGKGPEAYPLVATVPTESLRRATAWLSTATDSAWPKF
ncbi:MAG: hypothetical protein FJ184_16905, partial [Gammaproteobacteria bacterium]|nr:hypothetical protein [Gammaproteobacteria bacterium]